jgi:SAM-dependent methyltransferase
LSTPASEIRAAVTLVPPSVPGVTRSEELIAAWRHYFARAARERPRYPAARDFMAADLRAALTRLIPPDASVLEVGCGVGDLLAALPQTLRVGVDLLPEVVAEARRCHPAIPFHVGEAAALDRTDLPAFDAIVCDRLVHSVLDVQAMLSSLRSKLTDEGRIYLTTFNYLWEVPTRLAELVGWKLPSPVANWLSESDFENLFGLAGLEVVRFEDRLLLPLPVPLVGEAVNRYLAKLPVAQRLSLYRVYVLRKRPLPPPRARRVKVTVVVPTRNEAGNVEGAIARTPVMGDGTELIFVEGGSNDGTWEKIQSAIATYRGPLTLRAYQQTGKGKGDAVRLGFARATGDLLMILDADLTVPPEDLPVFFDAAVSGHADFLQGTRLVYPMDPGAMRFFNKIGNVAFSQLFTYLLQQPIKDTLCGTKVLWRSDYERIAAGRHVFGDFDPFGDFDLIFGAARLNLKIGEIPVRYRDRVYGETNISRWKHGWLLLRMSAVAATKLKYV